MVTLTRLVIFKKIGAAAYFRGKLSMKKETHTVGNPVSVYDYTITIN